MAVTRASKRRRTNCRTQKLRQEPNEEDDEKKQKIVAGDDTAGFPVIGGSYDEFKSNKSPVVVFSHGAGAPSSSDWMIRWKKMLQESLNAVEVVTFDYPYLAGGKKRAPPKAEKLVEFHMNIVKEAMVKYPGHPLILVGKSMGSRVSCMVACGEDVDASALVCLGYPLKGMNGAVRDETLIQLRVPIMFVQGSKDGLCPLEKLNAVRKKIKPVSDLHVIEGGDHSFKVGKKHLQLSGTTQDEAEDQALQAIQTFVGNLSVGKQIKYIPSELEMEGQMALRASGLNPHPVKPVGHVQPAKQNHPVKPTKQMRRLVVYRTTNFEDDTATSSSSEDDDDESDKETYGRKKK